MTSENAPVVDRGPLPQVRLTPGLRLLESPQMSLEKFLGWFVRDGFSLEEETLVFPRDRMVEVETLVNLTLGAFADAFFDWTPPERQALAAVARTDLLSAFTQPEVVEAEGGFLNLVNLFACLPVLRWRQHLPDDSLPAKLRLGEQFLTLLGSRAQNTDQAAAMTWQILSRPLAGQYAMDEAMTERFHEAVGLRWTGQRPLSAQRLVAVIGRQRVRRLLDAKALEPAPEQLLTQAKPGHVLRMTVKDTLVKEAQAEKKPLSQMVAANIVTLLDLPAALLPQLKVALEQAGLAKGTILTQLEGPTDLLVEAMRKQSRAGGKAVKSKAALANQLQRQLVERGPLALEQVPEEAAPLVSRQILVPKFTKDYQLRDGKVNAQAVVRAMTGLFREGGRLAANLLKDRRILDPSSQEWLGYAPMLRTMKEAEPEGSPARSMAEDVLLEQLRAKGVVEVQTRTVRERVASTGMELSLANIPLDEKVNDLDGTNLGSFGEAADCAQVMAAWARTPARWHDVATTLQTLYDKGRTEVLLAALDDPTLETPDENGVLPLALVLRATLVRVMAGQDGGLLGDIALSTDLLTALFQRLSDPILEGALPHLLLMEPLGSTPPTPPGATLLGQWAGAVVHDLAQAGGEPLRQGVRRWIHLLASSGQKAQESLRQVKAPPIKAVEHLLAALCAVPAKPLALLLPRQSTSFLREAVTALWGLVGQLTEHDEAAVELFLQLIKTLGYTPREPSCERTLLMIRRYLPQRHKHWLGG